MIVHLSCLGHVLDGGGALRDRLLRVRLLRVLGADLLAAEGLRLVVRRLLLREDFHHAVDLREDLGEVDGLRLQGELNQGDLLGMLGVLARDRGEGAGRAERNGLRPKLKGSIGEGSNHSNFSHQSSVKLLSKVSTFC